MENRDIAEEKTSPEIGRKRVWKTVLKICAWVAGIWIALLGILQIMLSPAVLTGRVEKYAG